MVPRTKSKCYTGAQGGCLYSPARSLHSSRGGFRRSMILKNSERTLDSLFDCTTLLVNVRAHILQRLGQFLHQSSTHRTAHSFFWWGVQHLQSLTRPNFVIGRINIISQLWDRDWRNHDMFSARVSFDVTTTTSVSTARLFWASTVPSRWTPVVDCFTSFCNSTAFFRWFPTVECFGSISFVLGTCWESSVSQLSVSVPQAHESLRLTAPLAYY